MNISCGERRCRLDLCSTTSSVCEPHNVSSQTPLHKHVLRWLGYWHILTWDEERAWRLCTVGEETRTNSFCAQTHLFAVFGDEGLSLSNSSFSAKITTLSATTNDLRSVLRNCRNEIKNTKRSEILAVRTIELILWMWRDEISWGIIGLHDLGGNPVVIFLIKIRKKFNLLVCRAAQFGQNCVIKY